MVLKTNTSSQSSNDNPYKEKLHMDMFYYKQEQSKKIENLEDSINKYIDLNREMTKSVEHYKAEHNILQTNIDELIAKREGLELELNQTLKKLVQTEERFKFEVKDLGEKLTHEKEKYTKKVVSLLKNCCLRTFFLGAIR